jgi:AAA15 family ATPase/GTPase
MSEISAIKLNKQLLGNYITNSKNNDLLTPLNKLNIFVAANNSGKSRLIRGILATKDLEYIPSEFDYESLQEEVKKIKDELKDIFDHSYVHSIIPTGGTRDLVQLIDNLRSDYSIKDSGVLISSLRELIKSIELLENRGATNISSGSGKKSPAVNYSSYTALGQKLNEIISKHAGFKEEVKKWNYSPKQFKKIYIPVLRGLRPLAGPIDDVYQNRTKGDYFPEIDGVDIFTGLKLYQSVEKNLRGDLGERSFIKDYEKYLSDTFFNGKNVALIPRIGKDVLTVKIGNEIEKDIYDLGDGLQTLIIITYPIFEAAQNNSNENFIVAIEEPELLMHPGLQRALMQELVESPKFANMQFLITTHSNHFLDLSIDYEDISIFRIRKDVDSDIDEAVPKFSIENTSNFSKNTLRLLGVRNSSVFLANATIWVEGITDRMYIRRAFDIYQRNNNKKIFQEDFHFSFIEYGGGNLVHWNFLEEGISEKINISSIVSSSLVIADRNDYKPGSGTERDRMLENLKSKLSDRIIILESREIENTISPRVLQCVIKELGGSVPKDGFTQENYNSKHMGEFLEKFGLPQLVNNYKTIKNKVGFAEKVIKNTNSYEDLSDEMIKICDKIYNFIEKENGGLL